MGDLQVDNLMKNLNPHSFLVRPVKLHPKIPKDQRLIRIPDASQKDSKIIHCATAANFYKNGVIIQDNRSKTFYKQLIGRNLENLGDESSMKKDDSKREYHNPPIPFIRKDTTKVATFKAQQI
jgi:hypothetical protein